MKSVTVYSDGACHGNPGPGGYGVILDYAGVRRERSQGYRLTTNNRMELLGVITGIEALKEPCAVTVITDSLYVIKAFEQDWIGTWQRNGWRTGDRKPVKTVDLWRRLLEASAPHALKFQWVRGHAGHPENEHCDDLANEAATGATLLSDDGYESGLRRTALLDDPT